METHFLRINGMHCKSCEVLLADVINEVPGAKAINVNHVSGVAEVTTDSLKTLTRVKDAIEAEGYSHAI